MKRKAGFSFAFPSFIRTFVPMNMQQLNLPPYEIRVREERGRHQIFDFLRHRYVTLTPEEWVRQHFVHFLVEHKGYPKGLLANEVELRIGEKKLRCDTLLYNKELQPQMIVEYKAPEIVLTNRVFDQITAYNMLLHVDYLVISNGLQHYCCRMDYEQRCYEFLRDIPTYTELRSEK
jgi:hypothetical protein